MYIARARSAKASEQLNEMLNRVGTGSAMNAFERMEEKVLQLEARSEAMAELSGDSLEKRFEALGQGDEIEAELAAMKGQINQGALSASQSVDPELEKLRSEIRRSI
jgi:phage shock protein A